MSKSLREILEKFKGSSRSRVTGEYREIFVNPDRNELRDLISNYERDSVRFIADSGNENIFVSSGDVWHIDILDEIEYLGRDSVFDTFWGIGDFVNGEIEINSFSDEYDGSILDRYLELCECILDGEYDWLKRYHFNLSEIKWIAEEEIDYYS